MTYYQKFGKRILDIIISLIAIPILIPLWAVIAIAIKLDSEGPVIFKQKRLGKNDEEYTLIKFRSMDYLNFDMDLSKEQNITRVGSIIRKFSLDETLQVVNVLKGDMSIVGPRPWARKKAEILTSDHRKRTDVLPGMTGLAKLEDNCNLDLAFQVEKDLEYIRNLSFKQDAKIIAQTAKYVLLDLILAYLEKN